MDPIPWYRSLEESLEGNSAPADVLKTLALISVPYVSFEGDMRTGQLVLRADLADEAREIFQELCDSSFPIAKIVPMCAYDWDDEASMADNNTSAFNYRRVIATDRLSNHSYGWAIDINPLLNPYYARDGNVYPHGATYEPAVPGTFTKDSLAVRLFADRDWTWGGDWSTVTDYQHFEKPVSGDK